MIKMKKHAFIFEMNSTSNKIDPVISRYYEVDGIITNSAEYDIVDPDVKMYPIEFLSETDSYIVIDDLQWAADIRTSFDSIIRDFKVLGKDYNYASYEIRKINTNDLFEVCEKDRRRFETAFKNILRGRKFVLFWGNCQMHAIGDIVSDPLKSDFCENYVTCAIPKMWENETEVLNRMIESGIFDHVDIFISQEVSLENKFNECWATEKIYSLCKKAPKRISVTNLYFMGYFPQLVDTKGSLNYLRNRVSAFHSFCDKNVVKAVLDGMDDSSILDMIGDEEFFSKDELRDNIILEIQDFEKREGSYDVRMSDFLLQNFDRSKLFSTKNHPLAVVMKEFARRICLLLECGFEDNGSDDNVCLAPMDDRERYPIYPSVFKLWGDNSDNVYNLRGLFQPNEMFFVDGIKIDEEHKEENGFIYINTWLSFRDLMTVYIRMIRSALTIT